MMRGKLPHFYLLWALLALPLGGCGSSDGDCAKTATCASTTDDQPADAASNDGSGPSDHSVVMSSEGGPMESSDGGARETSAEGSALDAPSDAAVADGPEAGPCGVDPPACYVDDLFAIFVSPKGSDTGGTGTKLAPFRSIAKAVASRSGSTKHVFACDDGTGYPESLSFNDASGVEALHGGFDCTSWLYDAKRVAKVAPNVLGFALNLSGLNTSIVIDNFELDSKDGVSAGDSSIAVMVASAKAVTIKRSVVQAGSGRAGFANAVMFNYSHDVTTPNDPLVVGNDATDYAPGAAKACTTLCTEGTSTGGSGTSAAFVGTTGLPNLGAGQPGGWSSSLANCGSATIAHNGVDAPAAAGGDGASGWGSVSNLGWLPAAGIRGKTGGPGQGGGGGDGVDTALGGGGGCGGCGGGGGSSGIGGGSSFAIISLSSQVTVSDSVLVVSRAGDGGPGVQGQPGQLGGAGGAAYGTTCAPAGTGGKGGAGGGGGGGAGGLAVGIGYQGTAPVMNQTTVMLPSIVALGGKGGSAAGQNPGTKGKDGVAQNTLQLP
jgi:hypothetical protein